MTREKLTQNIVILLIDVDARVPHRHELPKSTARDIRIANEVGELGQDNFRQAKQARGA
jgi:hypothetical protein